MKIKQILNSLASYFSATRQAGHTTVLLEGAQNHKDAIFVTANYSSKQRLYQTLPHHTIVTLSDVDCLYNRESPLVIDNHALSIIFSQANQRIEELEAELTVKKQSEESAFPTSPNASDPQWAAARTGGMTLRDYFAGQALSGYDADHSDSKDLAKNAYADADAMMEARKVSE
jgi:hypothetical protein